MINPYRTIVRQWITVCRSAEFGAYVGGVDVNWFRDVPMSFLPAAGQEVTLWPNEDGDPFGGVRWPVRSVYFASDGTAEIELTKMRVDPDARAVEGMALVPGAERAWRTDPSGWDLDEHLPRGGWKKNPPLLASGPMVVREDGKVLFPEGRTLWYEGDDPAGFAVAVREECGFDPASDPGWSVVVPARDGTAPFVEYRFHCPAEHLDAIYGSGRWRIGT